MSDDPAYGRTTPAPEPSGPPTWGQSAHGQQPTPGQQEPGSGPEPHGQPAHGQEPYGPPAHGQASDERSAYGQPVPGPPPAYGQPAYGQPAYGQPAYGQPAHGRPASGQPWQPASARTNVLAILSLVFAFVFSPLGIVLGFVARKQIRDRGEGGRGLATAGIIVGFAVLLIEFLFAVLIVVAITSSGGSSSTSGSSGAVVLGALALLR